jgi:carbon monoxide dehydrogenase subunit G
MAKAKTTVHIQRSPEVVWAFITDFPRTPEWITQLREVRVSPGAVGKGTQVTEVRSVPGSTAEGVVEVTEWEPPRRLRKVSPSGAVRADGLYELVATPDGGTDLTFSLDIRANGLLKPLEWLMGLGLQKGTEQDFLRLKQLLETSPVS